MKYSFRFNEVSMNQVWFEAENDEQAKSFINKVIDDEINISDLPESQERNRGIEMDYSVSILECQHEGLSRVIIYDKDPEPPSLDNIPPAW